MARTRKDGIETRGLILRAAAEVFDEKGFAASTHAEIGRRCGVNPALVNYHFSDKETLYRMAWEDAYRRTCLRYPVEGKRTQCDNPVDQLRKWIEVLIRRNADPECHDDGIWRRELANPTGLLDEIRRKLVCPLRRELGAIVRQIVGPDLAEDKVRLCTMSIIAQCRVPIAGPGECDMPVAFVTVDLESRIEHVFRFSLGGLELSARNAIDPLYSSSEPHV